MNAMFSFRTDFNRSPRKKVSRRRGEIYVFYTRPKYFFGKACPCKRREGEHTVGERDINAHRPLREVHFIFNDFSGPPHYFRVVRRGLDLTEDGPFDLCVRVCVCVCACTQKNV